MLGNRKGAEAWCHPERSHRVLRTHQTALQESLKLTVMDQ